MAVRIAVTGANGFVGRSFCSLLDSRGYEVVQGSRRPAQAEFVGCKAVVHLAALAHRTGGQALSYDQFHEANAFGARDGAIAARCAGAEQFVLVSTVGVHGDCSTGKPLDEASPLEPHDSYSRSKLAGELLAAESLAGSGTALTIVRPPMVIGPDAPGNWGRLISLVGRGWPMPLGSLRARRSYVSLESLCAFLVACLEQPGARSNTFLIADEPPLTTPALVSAIAAAQGHSSNLWRCPPWILSTCLIAIGHRRDWRRLSQSLVMDHSRAMGIPGWQRPDSLQRAIEASARPA